MFTTDEGYKIFCITENVDDGGYTECPLDGAHLRLDSTPAFVFYPETNEDGTLLYSAEAYKFFLGGTLLDSEIVTDENGVTYIVVKLPAHAIADTVTYTVDGTEISGAYNLRSYYDFALTQENDALVNLITRLWKYSESAKAANAQ